MTHYTSISASWSLRLPSPMNAVNIGETIRCSLKVGRCKVGISAGHSYRLLTYHLLDGLQILPTHDKATCKRMLQTMTCKALNFGPLDGVLKPLTGALHPFVAFIRKDPAFFIAPGLETFQGFLYNGIQSDAPPLAVFASWDRQDLLFQIHIWERNGTWYPPCEVEVHEREEEERDGWLAGGRASQRPNCKIGGP